MKSFTRFAFCMLALVVTVGCPSTKVTERVSQIGTKEKIAKPDRIYVYPFAATHVGIPTWATTADQYAQPIKPPTPEELEVGREVGAIVAKELVTQIGGMGLLALEGGHESQPQPNDLMIIGYFGAVEEGSAVKRLTLGFGSGAAELTTAVEGYQMTNKGPRLLGSAQLDSAGGKMPGLIVPLAVLAATANPIGLVVMGGVKVARHVTGKTKIEGAAKRTAEAIAEQLQVRFKEQGWIK
jgi:hypothetical protein